MASTFPTSLQDLDATRGTSGDKLNNPNHITHHQKEDDTIEALQTKVGIDSSADVTSLDYLVKNASSDGGGHVQTAAKGGTGQTTYTKGDILVAADSNTLNKLSVGSNGLALVADSSQTNGVKWGMVGKLGGTGADGALSITSGTTTIDLGGERIVIKNYTSISITGTGKLAFSNPHTNGTAIILKSQGDVTLTSSQAPMIDASGMGGAGGSTTVSNSISNGVDGNNGLCFGIISTTNKGLGGTYGSADGAGGNVASPAYDSTVKSQLIGKYPQIFVGAGGGGGGVGTDGTRTATSTGGNGGGGLIIECGGAWNFTTSGGISVAGKDGVSSIGAGTGDSGSGGAGGGGGGMCIVLYNSLTANSGTVTVSGGTGSRYTENSGGGYNSTSCRPGGGGGSYTNGSNGNYISELGGNGGVGLSIVALNIEF